MSDNGSHNGDGRGPGGKFAAGNPGGPGNPNAGSVAKQRAKFFAALRDTDVVAALKTIRRTMKCGKPSDELAAARELLDRVVGKAVQCDLLERIEALEERYQEARR